MLTVSLHCKLQDHLHIRGEYRFLLIFCFGHPGSPPHTWRIRNQFFLQHWLLGITSTYVENTSSKRHKRANFKDHLHIRGEYLFHLLSSSSLKGSPPHTWRIPSLITTLTNMLRITSTYVENTGNLISSHGRDEDHLHIRGEYPLSNFQRARGIGSPPHTWRIRC